MVDDPSEYVDVLREDPKLRRRAETALKAKLKLWEEAKDLAAKAEGTGLEVPEPGPEPTLDDILADQERQRLFRIIEDLVLWENTTNETVLQAARDEIWSSWRRTCLDNIDHPRAKELFDRHVLPAFHDPFAGGGALPLEAQRLGLESLRERPQPGGGADQQGDDRDPAQVRGPPAGQPRRHARTGRCWRRSGAARRASPRTSATTASGCATRRRSASATSTRRSRSPPRWRRSGPTSSRTSGKSLTVIAWLWARTVKSPNPAFAHVDVPLASTFMLSTKPGKEAYVEPVIEDGGYRFTVKVGQADGR